MEQTEESRSLQDAQAAAPKKRNVGRTILIVVIVLLVVAAVAAAFYGLTRDAAATAMIRDIMIIVLALVTIVIGLFLAILVFQLQSLIALLRNEIKPILESTQQTVNTVRGTTAFVSDNVVSPVVKVMSFAAGVGQTARVLVRGPNHDSRRRRQRGG